MSPEAPPRPITPGARIGHVHLEVADIERMLAFYVGVLGFTLTQRYGTQAAFVAAGGYHHYLAFNSWESAGGIAAAAGRHGALPPRDPLPDPGRPRRCGAGGSTPRAGRSTGRRTTA